MRVSSLICVVVTIAFAAMPAQAQSLKIATANPYRIYAQISESSDFKQKMDNDKQKLEKEANDRQMAIQLKIQQLRQVKPDHPTYIERSREIAKAGIDYKAWQEMQNDELSRQQKMKLLATYKKIEDAVARVAEQEKIDLVLSAGPKEFPATVEGITYPELMNLVGARNIMYSKNIPDISEKVIAMLDADYAKNPQR
ncbi:MAG TPA: OmpH family outer membrane protein [Humisphaera sp.]|jgi:Skp family chaperone for outer membrane proteins|nr:OmpH family outer membrane protein [Humisphaera sp.]